MHKLARLALFAGALFAGILGGSWAVSNGWLGNVDGDDPKEWRAR